jgi:hypothetical protein
VIRWYIALNRDGNLFNGIVIDGKRASWRMDGRSDGRRILAVDSWKSERGIVPVSPARTKQRQRDRVSGVRIALRCLESSRRRGFWKVLQASRAAGGASLPPIRRPRTILNRLESGVTQ